MTERNLTTQQQSTIKQSTKLPESRSFADTTPPEQAGTAPEKITSSPFNFSRMNLGATPGEGLPDTNNNPIQPKLAIGKPNDQYEQEANRVAQQVVQRIQNPQIDRQQVQQMSTPFKGHTDTQANQLSRSIQANAFTTGNDVFFKQGEYSPSSRSGQELPAHELTHIVQQNGPGRLNRKPTKATGIPVTINTTGTELQLQLQRTNEEKTIIKKKEKIFRKYINPNKGLTNNVFGDLFVELPGRNIPTKIQNKNPMKSI